MNQEEDALESGKHALKLFRESHSRDRRELSQLETSDFDKDIIFWSQ